MRAWGIEKFPFPRDALFARSSRPFSAFFYTIPGRKDSQRDIYIMRFLPPLYIPWAAVSPQLLLCYCIKGLLTARRRNFVPSSPRGENL